MIKSLAELLFASHKRPSLILVRRVVLLILILLSVLAALSFSYLANLQSAMTQVSEVHNRKVELIHRMSNIVQARSLQLYSVAFREDPWFRDERYMEFRSVAVDFVELRDRLVELGLAPEEQELMDEALDMIRVTAPLQEDLMQRMLGGDEIEAVWSDLVDIDLPLEMALLQQFADLGRRVQDNAYAARQDSEARYHAALRMLSLVTLLIILSVVLGGARMLMRLRYIESSLSEEQELSLGTLNNIADGVIITDEQGLILTMNNRATQMTGVGDEEARGQPVEEIYRLSRPAGDACMPASLFAGLLAGVATRAYRHHVLQDRKGALHYIEETISPIFDQDGGLVRVSYIFRDVSADLARMEKMSWDARHDHLTGALNRRAFEVELERACLEVKQGKTCTIIYLDLDDFKQLNDTYGHHAGDAYLVGLVRTMSSCIRRHDSLARMGGDEFAILLTDCSLEHARQIVDNLLTAIRDMAFTFEGRVLHGVGASIGVLALDGSEQDPDAVMRRVDQACYEAKRSGKNQVRVVA